MLSGHLEVAAGVLEEGPKAQFVELRRHLVMLLVGLLLVDGDGRLSVTMVALDMIRPANEPAAKFSQSQRRPGWLA